MFTDETLSYFWQMWVDLFSGLGLPWSSQTSAYFGLIVVFYVVGFCFKFLVSTKGK